MSRTRRKVPVTGATFASSDKPFKSKAHRSERRSVRIHLLEGSEVEELPHPKQFGNPWDGPKDGKIFHYQLPPGLMRK